MKNLDHEKHRAKNSTHFGLKCSCRNLNLSTVIFQIEKDGKLRNFMEGRRDTGYIDVKMSDVFDLISGKVDKTEYKFMTSFI